VGERLRYGARYGPFGVGKATMEVAGLDTVDGVETVHFIFRIEGGALWYHLDQTMESWVGRTDFRSRRFHQDTEERGRIWHHYYDIFPDSGFYREEGRDTTFATVQPRIGKDVVIVRSEEHTSELQSRGHLVCRLLLE